MLMYMPFILLHEISFLCYKINPNESKAERVFYEIFLKMIKATDDSSSGEKFIFRQSSNSIKELYTFMDCVLMWLKCLKQFSHTNHQFSIPNRNKLSKQHQFHVPNGVISNKYTVKNP